MVRCRREKEKQFAVPVPVPVFDRFILLVWHVQLCASLEGGGVG